MELVHTVVSRHIPGTSVALKHQAVRLVLQIHNAQTVKTCFMDCLAMQNVKKTVCDVPDCLVIALTVLAIDTALSAIMNVLMGAQR